MYILFSKYNRTRRPKFATCTSILEKEDSKNQASTRFISKSALYEEGLPHIASFADKYKQLSKIYKNAAIVPVSMENDRAFFPFIEGVAASTKIEAELHHLPDAVKKLNEFLDHVGDYHKEYVVEFEETEAFKEIFGRLDYVGAAAIGANIDEIPDNFFVTSEGLTLIDYEWVFSFPVPLRYIRFRSVYYFYVKHQSLIQRQSPEADNPNSDGGEAWFLELFGFDPEETAKWKQMEAQFQDFVHGPSHQHLYSTRYEQTIHDVNSFLNVVPDVAGEYNHLMNERQQLIDTLQLNHYIKHLWGLFKNRLHRSHK